MPHPAHPTAPLRQRRTCARRAAPRLTALAVLVAGLTAAQAQIWTGGSPFPFGSNTWFDPTNWSGGTPSPGVTTSITFGAGIRLTSVQNILSPFTLNALTFTSAAGAYNLSGFPLRFDGASARLVHNSGSNIKIANEVQVNANLAVGTTGTGVLELAGGLTRVGGTDRSTLTVTKQGSGTLALSTAGTYDATLRIDAGVVQLRHTSALQSANVLLNLDNGLSFSTLSNASLGSLAGTGALNLGTLALTLAGSDTAGLYSGAITGSTGSVTQSGGGTARWSGTSSFDNLNLKAGRLQLEGGSVTLKNTDQGLLVGDIATAGSASVLAVSGGARLSSLGSTVQVDSAGSALLSITGTGSTVNTGFQALVGNHAKGTLQVDTGGVLNAATYLGIGYDSGGTGTMKIGAGGSVSSSIGMVGVLAGSSGTVEVAGAGALWTTNSLTVGGFDNVRNGGSGAVTVRNGGQIQAASVLEFWSKDAKVTVDRGALRAAAMSSIAGNGQLNLVADPTGGSALVLDGAVSANFSGTITGGGTLVKSGTAFQSLSGANTGFTGTTIIRGGKIVLANASALVASTVQLERDDGLNLNGLGTATIGVLTGTGALSLGNTSLVLGGKGPGLLYSGAITGGLGNVVVAGGGVHRWSGVSQFDSLNITGGQLQLEGGALTLTSTNNDITGLMVGGGKNAPAGTTSLLLSGGAQLSFAGRTTEVDGISGTVLGITGAGTTVNTGFQILVGNHAFGKLTVDTGGTLNAATYLGMGFDRGSNGSLALNAGGTVTSDIGMLGVMPTAFGEADVAGSGARWSTNRLTIGGFNNNLRGGGGTLMVRSNGLVVVRDDLSFWSGSAGVTVNGGTLRAGVLSSTLGQGTIVLAANPVGGVALELTGATDASFAGVVSGGGTLLKSGTGKQTLASASTGFTGSTTIRGGQIVLGHQDALRASAVQLETDYGLNLNGLGTVTIGSLAGTGALDLVNSRLVLAGTGTAGLYSGTVIAQKGSVQKTGNGTARWSGGGGIDNLQVDNGRLQLEGGSLALYNTAQSLTVGTIGTAGAPNTAGVLALSGGAYVGSAITFVDGAAGTLLSVTGDVSRLTTGTQLMVGALGNGKLRVDSGGTVAVNGLLVVGQTTGGNGAVEVGAGGTLLGKNGIVGSLAGATGAADVAGAGAAWVTDILSIGGAGAGASGGAGAVTVRDGGFLQVSNGLRFWSSNASLTVNGGSVRADRLVADTGLGSITLTGDPAGGSALELNGATDSSFGGLLAGGGTLLKIGSGKLTLTGASTGFTGTTTIRNGQIIVGNQDALRGSSVQIQVANGLNVNGLSNVVLGSLAGFGALALGNTQLTVGEDNRSTLYTGTLSGAGATLVKKGTGTMTLGGGSSALNRLVVEGGGAVALTAGSLTLTSDSDDTVALALKAGGRVEVRGTAQLSANASGRSSIYLAGDDTTELLIDGPGARVNGGFQTLAGVSLQGRMTVRNGGGFFGSFALGAGFNAGSSGTISFESGAQGTAPLLLAGILTGSTGQLLVSGNGTVVRATQVVGLGGVSDSQRGGTGHLDISDGGAVITPQVKFWTANSTLRIDGGTLTATRVESAADVGAITLVSDPTDGAALVLGGGAGSYSYGGSIDGDGSLTKVGVTNQVLAGRNSFTGKVSVQGGTLTMGSSGASEYEVGAFGTLRLGERNLGFAVVQANAGGQVVYTNTTVNGGTLIGPGGHDISAVRRMVGTRVAGGTVLTPASGTTFVGVVNEGGITNLNGRTLTWTGGSNPTGSVLVAGTTTVSNFTSGGQLTVGPTGNLVSTSGNLVLGGGSRTTLGAVNSPGGTIELRAGGRVQVNGGLLVNNGSILAPVEVNFGGLAKGAGTYGAVFVNDGGRFSPGNSPGTVTTGDAVWGAGGGLVVELANAKGTAGWDWDLWTVHGALSIGAGTTANSRFTISLATLDNGNAAAPLAGFDAHRSWSWRIVDTDAGIGGFDASRVVLDTQGFLSPLAGGSLRLAVQDGDLYLQFNPLTAPVPEPQTWALLLGGLGVLAWAARRRRQG